MPTLDHELVLDSRRQAMHYITLAVMRHWLPRRSCCSSLLRVAACAWDLAGEIRDFDVTLRREGTAWKVTHARWDRLDPDGANPIDSF